MNKQIKKAIKILIIVIVIIIAIISTFFIVKYFINRAKIDNVLNTYSSDNVQNRLDNENTLQTNNLTLKIDGENVLGVIKIDKLNFEGLIYEGTSLSTLSKGVGHFENSPYLNGNVCLAAHNTNNYWAKLNTLEIRRFYCIYKFFRYKRI